MHRCISSLVWGLGLFWELTLTKSFRAFSLLRASPWAGEWEGSVGRQARGAGSEPQASPGDPKGAWLALPRSRARPQVEARGLEPHLLHQHLHVVGAAPAVGLHDEAEAQGHRRHMHLGAGERKEGLSLATQPLPTRSGHPGQRET